MMATEELSETAALSGRTRRRFSRLPCVAIRSLGRQAIIQLTPSTFIK